MYDDCGPKLSGTWVMWERQRTRVNDANRYALARNPKLLVDVVGPRRIAWTGEDSVQGRTELTGAKHEGWQKVWQGQKSAMTKVKLWDSLRPALPFVLPPERSLGSLGEPGPSSWQQCAARKADHRCTASWTAAVSTWLSAARGCCDWAEQTRRASVCASGS